MKRYHVIVVESAPMAFVPMNPDSKTPVSDALEEVLAKSPRPALDCVVEVPDTEVLTAGYGRPSQDEPSAPVAIPVQRQVRLALEAARPNA